MKKLAAPASVFIEPPGVLETAPFAVQRVFGAMRIHSRDPKLPFRSRVSFVDDVVFNRIEAVGHVDLEWLDHDPEVRDIYRWLVLSSSGGAAADDRVRLLATRELALFDGASLPDELHLSGTSRNLIIMIPSKLVPNGTPLARPVAADFGAGAVLAAMARSIEAQAFSGGADRLRGLIPLFINTMAVALAQVDAMQSVLPQDARLSRIIDHIELHLDDPELNADATARACGVSLRQLHRLFQPTAETFSATLRRLRLERAVLLLANPNLKISDLAADCGFPDAAYFSTIFTHTYGETPRARRKKILETAR